jgi:hypothetical protein
MTTGSGLAFAVSDKLIETEATQQIGAPLFPPPLLLAATLPTARVCNLLLVLVSQLSRIEVDVDVPGYGGVPLLRTVTPGSRRSTCGSGSGDGVGVLSIVSPRIARKSPSHQGQASLPRPSS